MSFRFVLKYLVVLVVGGSITSQVLAWLTWFSPLALFLVALGAGLVAAHLVVVRPRQRTSERA
jgi:hypothetical protein